ncbi:MAG: sigma-70 family RNA polymerase sigma factor [Frankiaceae bacterium]
MSGQAAPDWAAIYSRHRDAMYRVARSILREASLGDHAPDVVQDALTSLIASPPDVVDNWQAFMVTAVKRKALDLIRSAPIRHAGPSLGDEHDFVAEGDLAEEVAERVDRPQAEARVQEALSCLDARQRTVAWEYLALKRPRAEIAAKLEVSPARVSQIATEVLRRLRTEMSREEGAG